MVLTAILTGLTVFFALIAALFIVQRRFIRVVRLYLEPQGEKHDQPSEFALALDMVSSQLASKMALSIKGSLMGEQSVDAKMTKRMETALTVDGMASQGGVLGALAQLPNAEKLISKNAGYIPILMSLLGNKGQAKQPANGTPESAGVSLNTF